MLFNSIEFLLFFPIVTAIYFLLPHRFRWLHLLLASCVFYMFFIPVYILILFFTIVIDYFAGIYIENTLDKTIKKRFLVLSIIANVSILCVFKYYNFFVDNVNVLLGMDNDNSALPYLKILLPIGLSFHTFQAMSYTIEVYRGNQKAERHFGYYALYVMFYPQLVAGPIERPQNLLHQFHEEKHFNYQYFREGMLKMLWGFFKKLVIADRLAIFVDKFFGNLDGLSGAPVVVAIFFFAIQIYCDFSGYSDIAIGSAKVMGFDLMKNFNRPYLATSIADFWRRWHISLNTWFVDYLYTPLVTHYRNWGKWSIAFGLIITFSISGLWHGANWTFIIWGSLHGLALTYDLLTKKTRKLFQKNIPFYIYNPLSILLTFSFVCFTYLFFRAKNLGDATYILTHLGNFQIQDLFDGSLFSYGLEKVEFISALLLIVFLLSVELLQSKISFSTKIFELPVLPRWSLYTLCILAVIILGEYSNYKSSTFIYFQF